MPSVIVMKHDEVSGKRDSRSENGTLDKRDERRPSREPQPQAEPESEPAFGSVGGAEARTGRADLLPRALRRS